MNEEQTIQAVRERIAALDGEILEALNARIRLVQSLRALKEARGLPFHDPAQEARLLARLAQVNEGPLPEEGLREIFGLILAWAKRTAEAE